MVTVLLFGKYSSEALKGISGERTKKSNSTIESLGGKVISMYALLGQFDIVLVVEFPDMESAMKISIELSKLTGIAFTTMPAIPVEKFDKIMAKA